MEVQISNNASDFSLTCSPEDASLLDKEMNTLTTELKDDEESTTCTATITSVSVRRVRVVVSLVGKLVLPAVVGVYYAYLRNRHTLSEVLPSVVAFLTNGIARSLSSVHGAVTYPSNKIDPLLRVIKLRYRPPEENSSLPPCLASEDSCNNSPERSESVDQEPCVTCTVLCEPPPGEEHTADVIFIHGLHGSLVKTWRQGDWKMAKERAESVELRRRASMSCLQSSTVRHQTLKRSASANCSEIRPRTKIPKSDFNFETFCECDSFCSCNQSEMDSCIVGPSEPVIQTVTSRVENSEPKSECWPRDWLPKDCPGVRVIALSYTTDPYLWRPIWIKEQTRTNMEERSNEMMDHLLKIGVGKKPIIWVGHSKGGLFIKQMIVDAWEQKINEPEVSSLCFNTKAIMFFSVPHKGSSLADFNLPFVRQSVELVEIKKNCDKVLDLHKNFMKLIQQEHISPEIFSFIETSLTSMAFMFLRIVTYESCDPGVGITWGVPLDHREICKPTSRQCFLYQELVELIHRSISL